MKKLFAMILVALTALAGAEQSVAQVRTPTYAPKAGVARVRPTAPKPNVILIPPSAALIGALRTAPGAKPLGAPRLKGSRYIVKLKQGGKVIQLNVNAATGAVMR